MKTTINEIGWRAVEQTMAATLRERKASMQHRDTGVTKEEAASTREQKETATLLYRTRAAVRGRLHGHRQAISLITRNPKNQPSMTQLHERLSGLFDDEEAIQQQIADLQERHVQVRIQQDRCQRNIERLSALDQRSELLAVLAARCPQTVVVDAQDPVSQVANG